MKIWFDLTAAAHPIVFAPVIERLRAAGHTVEVTARDYGQTLSLARRHGVEHVAVGPGHAGGSRVAKAWALAGRTAAMARYGRGRGFDLAIGHGSNDLALAAGALRIPAVNTFDYEWASAQHRIGCRLAHRVVVPEAIPPSRLTPYGVTEASLVRYPGLKEEYYLHDFEPDHSVLEEVGVDWNRIVVVLRPPPEVTLYHRGAQTPFPAVLDDLGRREDVHAIVLPRIDAQREHIRTLRLPSVLLAEEAVDAQSLIALADLVVSAGGTMNREAVALGTPVYTTFGGRLGGVDEQLLAEGRLRRLEDPGEVDVVKHRGDRRQRVRRDPADMARMLIGAEL